MTTIEHDPDDPRGCIACPLFHGVPRDGGCRALDGPNGMNTLNHGPGGRFVPDFRCPLRNGGVHVRAPLPVADHHEPAEGDAVRVDGSGETWRRVAERATADLGTVRSALGTIAITLGMSTDALPGAIVERVEQLARDHGYVRNALGWATSEPLDTNDVIVKVRQLLHARDEAVSEGERRIDALDAEVRQYEAGAAEVRTALGARDDETTLDAARRVASEVLSLRGSKCTVEEANAVAAKYICERDALGESIEAALGDACTGDLAADVRRVVAELDEQRRLYSYACDSLRAVNDAMELAHEETSRGELVAATKGLRAEVAAFREAEPCCNNYRGAYSEEQGHHCLSCDESFPMTSRAEAIAEARQEERERLLATLATALPAIRAGINACGSRPEDVQARIGAHRALDGLAQGQPLGVVLSAEDDAAGRPLASEGSE